MSQQNVIQDQVNLPLPVVLEIVLQGLRIRLGRSMVTIAGVALGITFLMSMLVGQLIRQGLQAETALRNETTRMLNVLQSDTGPLRDKVVAVYATAATLEENERRLIEAVRELGVKTIRWQGPAAAPAYAQTAAVESLGDDATAIIITGGGAVDERTLDTLLAKARQPVAARTKLLAQPTPRTIALGIEPRPEDVARAAADARRDRARSIWIIVISLLVTTIGICNAMLLSVTERFREIGTMKCLGALSSFIRRLFVVESLIVGAIGTVLGIILGTLVPIAVDASSYGLGMVLGGIRWPQFLLYAAIAFAAGVTLSTLAALYPARIASRMVPAAALRSTI